MSFEQISLNNIILLLCKNYELRIDSFEHYYDDAKPMRLERILLNNITIMTMI